MLVLSRKKDESIVIKRDGQQDIKITVVKIDNRNKVRLGIEADKQTIVLRSELEDRDEKISLAESNGHIEKVAMKKAAR